MINIIKFPIRLFLTIILFPMLVMWLFFDIAFGDNITSDFLKDLWKGEK